MLSQQLAHTEMKSSHLLLSSLLPQTTPAIVRRFQQEICSFACLVAWNPLPREASIFFQEIWSGMGGLTDGMSVMRKGRGLESLRSSGMVWLRAVVNVGGSSCTMKNGF
ncbi:hypothetical protein V6N13_097796 [Hibiscus sabdariffa]